MNLSYATHVLSCFNPYPLVILLFVDPPIISSICLLEHFFLSKVVVLFRFQHELHSSPKKIFIEDLSINSVFFWDSSKALVPTFPPIISQNKPAGWVRRRQWRQQTHLGTSYAPRPRAFLRTTLLNTVIGGL